MSPSFSAAALLPSAALRFDRLRGASSDLGGGIGAPRAALKQGVLDLAGCTGTGMWRLAGISKLEGLERPEADAAAEATADAAAVAAADGAG